MTLKKTMTLCCLAASKVIVNRFQKGRDLIAKHLTGDVLFFIFAFQNIKLYVVCIVVNLATKAGTTGKPSNGTLTKLHNTARRVFGPRELYRRGVAK